MPAGTRGPLRENAHAGRTAQQHTGVADHSAFPAQWLDGLCRDLPGADHSSWPPSPFELTMPSARLGSRTSSNGLTVAGNLRARRSLTAPSSARGLGLTGTTRPARASRADAAASTASPAREHDDFTSPLLGEPGWATHTPKPNFGKVEYFRARGLTRGDTASRVGWANRRLRHSSRSAEAWPRPCPPSRDRGLGTSMPSPTLQELATRPRRPPRQA